MSGLIELLAGLGGGSPGAIQAPTSPIFQPLNDVNALQQPIDEDLDAMVKGFKPTKRNFIGRLADALSGQPIYKNRMDDRDFRRIMGDFANDPREAARLVGKHVSGPTGWQMLNQVEDNERADTVANSNAQAKADRRLERTMGVVASMLRSVKDPSAYPAMRQRARTYAKARGITDLPNLPEAYDPDAIEQFINGEVDLEDQLRMEALAAYRDKTIDLKERQFESLDEHRDETREERERHNRTGEGFTGRRVQIAEDKAKGKTKGQIRTVKTPAGEGKMSADGKRLIVGGNRYERQANGSFKKVN